MWIQNMAGFSMGIAGFGGFMKPLGEVTNLADVDEYFDADM
jgi:hypothetical protein